MLAGRSLAESREILSRWEAAIGSRNLYGFGFSRLIFTWKPPFINADFNLKGVLDNNPALWGQTVMGFDILPPDQAPELDGPIVIFTDHYFEVRDQLRALGLREGWDFISRDDYWTLLSFFQCGKIYAAKVISLPITGRCTLRCRHCGSRTPEAAPVDWTLAEFEEHLENIFSRVDALMNLNLYGGEPFLHPQLPNFIDLAAHRHGSRIAMLDVVSNGTVAPGPELIAALKRHDAKVIISDYSGCGIPGYEEGLARTLAALAEGGTPPRLVRRQKWWRMEASPAELQTLAAFDDERMRRHIRDCGTLCSWFGPDHFSYCVRLKGADRRAFEGLSRLETVARLLGYSEKGYFDECRLCRGGHTFPKDEVPTAEQLPAKKGKKC